METYDVLIIGGGPAGSSLAWGLRNSGLKVAIVDKQSFPRDKTCAGWITPAVIGALDIDIDDYKKRNTLQAITGFHVGIMYGKGVDIHYDGIPVSYGIRRCELDHYLLQRSGVEFHPGFNVESINRHAQGWLINNTLSARLLVGAGGNFCPVARMLGAKSGQAEISVRAQEIEFRLDADQARVCPVDPAMPELYFCEDLKGYGWVFRKGDYLNVGLGREADSGLPRKVREFCSYLQQAGRIPHDLPEKFHGHAYLLYDHAERPLYGEAVLLLGDAAGLAYTRSGEGIRPAVESGLIAADVIRNCGGVYTEGRLHGYQSALTRRFGRRNSMRPTPATTLAALIPTTIQRQLTHKLLGMGWFTRKFVIENGFLHHHQRSLDLTHQ